MIANKELKNVQNFDIFQFSIKFKFILKNAPRGGG
jgi:hypothetical protein